MWFQWMDQTSTRTISRITNTLGRKLVSSESARRCWFVGRLFPLNVTIGSGIGVELSPEAVEEARDSLGAVTPQIQL